MEHARIGSPHMSEHQFLVWAEAQEGRWELVEGIAMMQAGATRDHERVAKRVFALLYAQVDEKRFDVNKGDFGVRIRPGSRRGSILYPDVLVDLQSDKGDEQATLHPVIVIEVLSKTTDLRYHVRKFESYKSRDTLQQYIVFDQKRPKAFAWTKTNDGWPSEPQTIEGASATVSFPSVGAAISMAAIYRTPEPLPDGAAG